MELYTLISLVVGIFGATYASLNSLRINLEAPIKEAADNAQKKLDAIISVWGKESGCANICMAHTKNILRWKKVWVWANAVPAILFSLIIGFIVVWVLIDWNDVTVQHGNPTQLATVESVLPWCGFRSILAVMALADLLCVAAGILAWFRCKSANSSLSEHHVSLEDLPTFQSPGRPSLNPRNPNRPR